MASKNRNQNKPRSSSIPANGVEGRLGKFLLPLIVGAVLTYLFWSPLFHGAGIIGGDTYPYYFPQKAFLADSLQQGEIPLWNPLVGFGYPILGESQTAALYPPNLILYSTFSLNTAYNLNQILHSLMAFMATWALGRRLGLQNSGALLAATVYTFGWFPPRLCLEWAIIGGAWLVAILWAATAYLQTRSIGYLCLMSLFLGLDLLAGHYNLAFITLLLLVPLPWLVNRKSAQASESPQRETQRSIFKEWTWLGVAICIGFGIGAVQLLPTWELKQQSQRQEVNETFSPTYGHLPPTAISQLIMPWKWHAGEKTTDQLLAEATTLAVTDATNKAEAHIYCGLLPLLLIVLTLLLGPFREQLQVAYLWRWGLVGGVGLLFATGWPTYFLQDIPGFGFFRGPGRYSVATALSIGIISGAALDAILKWLTGTKSIVVSVTLIVLGITAFDLWAVSREYGFGASPLQGRQVFYATIVDSPPINYREVSDASATNNHIRVYAPGANVPTMLGYSALPVYLGIGPEIYESDDVRVDWKLTDPNKIKEAIDRLKRFGVTLLILEEPLDTGIWPVNFLGQDFQPLLNASLARQEPYFLYEINDALETVYFLDSEDSQIEKVNLTANQATIKVDAVKEADLVLTQLMYPGWNVTIDGQPAEATTTDELFRTVRVPQGEHTVEWKFQSRTHLIGLIMTLLSILALLSIQFYRKNVSNRPSV